MATRDFQLSLHPLHDVFDKNNKGSWHNIRHVWLTFHGQSWHASRPYTGQRLTVIFFVPQNVEKLGLGVHEQLRQLGFLVPHNPRDPESWLQPISSEDGADEQYVTNTQTPGAIQIMVIAERQRVLLQTLKDLGGEVQQCTHAHVRARRSLPEDLKILRADVLDQRPHLLWLQWQGDAAPGRRAQTKMLASFLHALIQEQLKHGQCVLECRASDLPIREEVINSPEWQQLLPYKGIGRGCQLASPSRAERCCGYLALASYSLPQQRCLPDCRHSLDAGSTRHLMDSQQLYAKWVTFLMFHLRPAVSEPSTSTTTTTSSAMPSSSGHLMSKPTMCPSEQVSSQPLYPTEAALRAKQRKQQLPFTSCPT